MTPFSVHIRIARVLVIIFVVCTAFAGCGGDNVSGKAESVAAFAGGAGGPGFFDGSPSAPVRFDTPSGVAITTTGDRFVADTENQVIRKIDASGNVTTFAGAFGIPGSADGTGAAARFNMPSGITAVGTVLFLCDTGNHTIRRISASGVVTTLAGSPGVPGAVDNTIGASVRFSSPRGITSNVLPGQTSLTPILYVADTGNNKIRRMSTSGATTTIAGSGTPGFVDGSGASASFSSPEGITYDGSAVFVADTGNHAIRQVTLTAGDGNVTTLAGDGTPGFVDNTSGASVRFSSPVSLASVGSYLYVSDTGNHVIRNVNTTNLGFTTTVAGTPQVAGYADGTGTLALFDSPEGIASDGLSLASLYLADTGNHTVRQVTLGGSVTTVAGNPPQTGSANGTGAAARFQAPAGIAVIGDEVFVADTDNHTIRKIDSTGVVTTIAGAAGSPGSTDSPPRFRSPAGITALGGDLYVSDSGNNTIRMVTTAGVTTTIAGTAGSSGASDGNGTAALFSNPQGIVGLGGDLYVADSGNNTIRKVTTGGTVTTVSGSAGNPGSADGIATVARFRSPLGIAVLGTSLYVADTGNNTIRKVLVPSGATSTFAGSAGQAGDTDGAGGAARFSSPDGIAGIGSALYVADRGNHAVRRISTSARVTTFVGTPEAATTRNGNADSALLNAPAGITGVEGTIYFTDINENVVREILF
ncbi:MAG: NHL repeat-containing protein [Candidatus Deferrimicrobiaceae bacterium]